MAVKPTLHCAETEAKLLFTMNMITQLMHTFINLLQSLEKVQDIERSGCKAVQKQLVHEARHCHEDIRRYPYFMQDAA